MIDLSLPTTPCMTSLGHRPESFFVGDLVLIAVRDRFVLAEVSDERPDYFLAGYGDFSVRVMRGGSGGLFISRHRVTKEISKHVGESFEAVEAAVAALKKYLVKQ